MPCKVCVSTTLCTILLSLGFLTSADKTFQPWISKIAASHLSKLTDGQESPQDIIGSTNTNKLKDEETMGQTLMQILQNPEPYIVWNARSDTMDREWQDEDSELPQRASVNRQKRVFLSRGWAAGGYKVPLTSTPNRFVRRPPAILETPLYYAKPNSDGTQDSHYGSIVPDELQQSPTYRRFHSIFTSGMWTPMGKRSYRRANLSSAEGQNFDLDLRNY